MHKIIKQILIDLEDSNEDVVMAALSKAADCIERYRCSVGALFITGSPGWCKDVYKQKFSQRDMDCLKSALTWHIELFYVLGSTATGVSAICVLGKFFYGDLIPYFRRLLKIGLIMKYDIRQTMIALDNLGEGDFDWDKDQTKQLRKQARGYLRIYDKAQKD